MEFLIIDDNKTFRDATSILIADAGHDAEGAENGQIGLARIKDEKFDAVLLDVHLGEENGLDLLTQIRRPSRSCP
jgi:NtrC-family two-component system response regulator AlgB